MQYILQNHPARETQVTEDFESIMAEQEQVTIVNDAMITSTISASNPF
jgi:hypothetical protein